MSIWTWCSLCKMSRSDNNKLKKWWRLNKSPFSKQPRDFSLAYSSTQFFPSMTLASNAETHSDRGVIPKHTRARSFAETTISSTRFNIFTTGYSIIIVTISMENVPFSSSLKIFLQGASHTIWLNKTPINNNITIVTIYLPVFTIHCIYIYISFEKCNTCVYNNRTIE